MNKLEIFPYNKNFIKIFKKEKKRILKVLSDCEIYHIGSTAVPGLGGKGIIDILIALKDWKKEKDVIKKLKIIGFEHIHPKDKGRIFLSKIGTTKYGDTHIHIVKKGNKNYKELIDFRDYLRKHKTEAEKYFNLKLEWLKKFKGNRPKYTKTKESYIKDVLKMP